MKLKHSSKWQVWAEQYQDGLTLTSGMFDASPGCGIRDQARLVLPLLHPVISRDIVLLSLYFTSIEKKKYNYPYRSVASSIVAKINLIQFWSQLTCLAHFKETGSTRFYFEDISHISFILFIFLHFEPNTSSTLEYMWLSHYIFLWIFHLIWWLELWNDN